MVPRGVRGRGGIPLAHGPRSSTPLPAPRSLALLLLAAFLAPLGGAGYATPGTLPCQASSVDVYTTSDNVHLVASAQGLGRSIGEMHHVGGDLFVSARYREATGGIDVWDMSDPEAPRHVAGYNQTWTGTKLSLDVKLTTDGRTALIGQYHGIELVDLSDPAAPAFESRYAFPKIPGANQNIPNNMAHMMYVYEVDDEDYVFVATQWNYGIYVLKVVGAPGARTLQDVTVYMPFQNPVALGQHDTYATYDHKLKKHLLYVANGFEGWAVADISDPANPTTLAIVPEVSLYQGYTHTVQASWVQGRRIVATVTEIGHNSLKVYDATDLTLPVMIGEWNWNPTSPKDAIEEEHNIQIVEGKIVMAHKWQGVFIFDLDDLVRSVPAGSLGLPEPLNAWHPIAHWQPPAQTPRVKLWDVVVKDGLIYTADYGDVGQTSYQGIYVLQFGCWTPGTTGLTSNG